MIVSRKESNFAERIRNEHTYSAILRRLRIPKIREEEGKNTGQKAIPFHALSITFDSLAASDNFT